MVIRIKINAKIRYSQSTNIFNIKSAIICNFCKKSGHSEHDCYRKKKPQVISLLQFLD